LLLWRLLKSAPREERGAKDHVGQDQTGFAFSATFLSSGFKIPCSIDIWLDRQRILYPDDNCINKITRLLYGSVREPFMLHFLSKPCTAFQGTSRIAAGPLIDVALAVKAALDANPTSSVLTFDDATGAVVDLDLRGETAEIVARLAQRAKAKDRVGRTPRRTEANDGPPDRGRGRPKLGVVAREVTLLPRHWDWLALQPGGASQALRRLVDDARRGDGGSVRTS
jgi:hypothetical protein